MPASRAIAILGLVATSMLFVPATTAQTLLWSARYDSGGVDNLGVGRPFRVEASGAVTLAGKAGDDFFMVRYLPDGTFDKARLQQLAFSGGAVVVDREGRSVWAGSGAGPVAPMAILLTRLSFTASPEPLFSVFVGPVEAYYGIEIHEAGDGGLLLGYHLSGHAFLSVDFVAKIGGIGPGWTVQDGGNLCGGRVIAPDPLGGAVASLPTAARSMQRTRSTARATPG